MIKCEICSNEFIPRIIKKPPRTCSKQCKNKLASQITKQQFNSQEAKDRHREISLKKKQDPEYQKKFAESIDKRTERWNTLGHPRLGVKHPPGTSEKISKANKGKHKGLTWDEIYGKDVADRRRQENALSMSLKNETLIKEKRSSLEEQLLPFLPKYENNVQISKYNVDFVNRNSKHIIEIYGDYWHCNPKIYDDNFIHHYFKMTAKERRRLDEERVKYLESLGYKVTIIWESDLKAAIADYKKKYMEEINESTTKKDR